MHYPLKAKRIMSIVRDMRDGKEYDARFGIRQTGNGAYAALFAQRFRLKRQKLGMDRTQTVLDTSQFTRMSSSSAQLEMF